MDPTAPNSDGVCYFLTLPGEIRNIIYEYVLTEAEPIVHRLDKQLSRFDRTQSAVKIRIVERHSEDDDEDDYDVPANLYVGPTPSVEVNQLQYVSHQFRYETKGLELRYNDLTFQQVNRRPHTHRQFLRFLKSCSPSRHSEIRTVTLGHEPSPCGYRPPYLMTATCRRDLRSIVTFCRAHPNAHVKVYFPELYQDYTWRNMDGFFLFGVMVGETSRDLYNNWHVLSDRTWEQLVEARRQWNCGHCKCCEPEFVDAFNAPNCRFFPAINGLKEFDAAKFRDCVQAAGQARHMRFYHDMVRMFGSVDKYVEVVAGWYKGGF
ncbi:hypothetical protein BDV95DRAFT_572515 [Massariosphaeria phaeospora]|uniref:Uncharacterized protein n=1 Tax=Massariosphaeria phaeospora TaxID=100035 RepID=A0A7C8I9S3_9PLEO|nr:hypothetical protein BDV95DRAFT_572515 [Massariosphaeria phaeospora]